MSENIISVKDLSKKFQGIQAVDHLSFSVRKGEIYGFLGQNGAGKSTTIRMLLTLVRPSSGEIQVLGMNLASHSREILKHVGAIIESPDLYTYLSALENLQLLATMSGKHLGRKELMEKLAMVGLATRATDKVRTYSQGMKQRLGIAAALVHDPEIVILDEPTNGLDPQGIADIRNLVVNLSKQQGKTILVSSHLLSEVELMADSMLIIDQGKKIAEGRVKELLNPDEVEVEVELEGEYFDEDVFSGTAWQGRWRMAGRNKISLGLRNRDISSLVSHLVERGIGIRGVRTRHSLETYFLSLTKNG